MVVRSLSLSQNFLRLLFVRCIAYCSCRSQALTRRLFVWWSKPLLTPVYTTITLLQTQKPQCQRTRAGIYYHHYAATLLGCYPTEKPLWAHALTSSPAIFITHLDGSSPESPATIVAAFYFLTEKKKGDTRAVACLILTADLIWHS
jgi:hypothetical protein